jgi:hypothetical protein
MIDLPAWLPSYIKTANRGYLPNTVFLGIFLLLVVLALTGGRSQSRRGRCGLAPTLIFFGIFSLSSLFPRPDLANPQRLLGPRELPCQVYFYPAATAGSEKATWLCSGPHSRLRIETLVPLRSVEISVQNRSAREALEMTAVLFDAAAARLSLPAGALDQMRWDRPRYKKIKARYGYQFDLQARSGLAATAPAWLLGLKLR